MASSAPLEPSALQPESQLGPYRVVRQLAIGGMGVVYEASDERLDRKVCLKLMHPGMDRDRLAARFEQEARAAGKLRHPGIVRLHGFEQVEDRAFLVMDLVEGEPLDQYVTGHRPDRAWCLAFFDELLQAIAYMHRHGVIHRDLKPGNLIVDPQGRPRVIDFSLGKVTDQTQSLGLTQDGDPIGTPVYMPPEQILGRKTIDQRADIYALGVILYELLVGARPFEARSLESLYGQILNQEPVPPHERNPAIAPGLSRAVLRAMAREPALRYPDAEAFRRGLISGEAAPARRPGIGVATLLLAALAGALLLERMHASREAVATLPSAPTPASTLPGPSRASLEQRLADRLVARYRERGRAEDLVLAARLDPGRQPLLMKQIDRWRKLGRAEDVLDGLAALRRPLPPAKAASYLAWCLARADPDRPELGRRAVAFFRTRHPRAALQLESRLLGSFIDKPAPDTSSLARMIGALFGIGRVPGYWPAELLHIARSRYDRGEYRAALALMQAVEQLGDKQRKNPWFFYIRGLILQALGQHSKAIEDFERCWTLAHNGAAKIHVAVTLIVAGRDAEALLLLRNLEPVLARDKVRTWVNVVRFHKLLLEAEAGVPGASEALAQLVERLALGWFAGFQHQYPPATRVLRRVRKLLPRSPAAAAHLGCELIAQGKQREGRDWLARSLKEAPAGWKRRKQVSQMLEKKETSR